jgi:hypothetical protein
MTAAPVCSLLSPARQLCAIYLAAHIAQAALIFEVLLLEVL